MQLGCTSLDLSATLKFYKAVVGSTTRPVHESGDYCNFETGSTALVFSSSSLMM